MADDLIQSGETAYYRALIRQYDKAASRWHQRGKKIVKRYMDERADGQANVLKYNILWSNVENLKPALFAQTPKPEVERRFLDKDPVARLAASAIERLISYYLHTTPFGSAMRQARNDYLLVGRGVTWVRYVPTFRKLAAQTTDDVDAEEIAHEVVTADYVHWQDFGHNVGRTWEEVFCVWRIVYMTREQMKARNFEAWNDIPLDYADKDLKQVEGEDGKKATIYEIWDKNTRKAYWIAKSWSNFLDKRDDPLKLDRFFPCSEPMFATLSNDSLIPVPDYAEYQDQAEELDGLTARIGAMQKGLKVAGVYDASVPELQRILDEGVDNRLIGVANWAVMNEKGGLANAIQLLPVLEVAQTLVALYDTRAKVLEDLYQITGLSDLIRGATNPNETATAQQIKSNFINLRLSEKQREMQRLARNTIEIMGNVIARWFTDDTIKRVSGLQLLTKEQKVALQAQAMIGHNGGPPLSAPQAQPQAGPSQPAPGQPQPQASSSSASPPEWAQEAMSQPSWDEVIALIRDNPDRNFRIDIETDSTVQADEQADQQQATQFVEAVGGFLQQAEQAAGNPDVAVFLAEMLSWACRRFPISRDLQGAIDTLTEKMAKTAQNPQPPKPDPDMAKVQGQLQIAQQELQGKQQLAQQQMQIDARGKAAQVHADAQVQEAQGQRQMAIEQQKGQITLQIEREKMALEDQRQRDQFERQVQADLAKAELQARTQIEVAEIGAKATLQTAQISAANDASSEAA